MFPVIRLIFAVLMFLLSLLALFRAPTNLLWKCSIVITEWSHIFMLIVLLPFLSKWWMSWSGKIAAILSFSAFLFSITPLLRAMRIAALLPEQVEQAFGPVIPNSSKDEPSRPQPLVFTDLWSGVLNHESQYSTVVYKNTGNETFCLDFYRAKTNTLAPCVLLVHGGAWDSGDSRQLPSLNSYLAQRGYNVAAINYRLSPKHQFPAPLEDVKSAITYLKQHSASYNIDSNKIVLIGRSAGGQIALMGAYTFKDPCVCGVVAFYTPADMIWAYSAPGNPLILDSRKVLEDYLGGSYTQVPDNYRNASPLEFADTKSPPTLIIHGIRDEMVSYEHSRRLNKKLSDAKVKHLLLTLPWATHGCDYNFSGPSAQISTYAIERFLAAITH